MKIEMSSLCFWKTQLQPSNTTGWKTHWDRPLFHQIWQARWHLLLPMASNHPLQLSHLCMTSLLHCFIYPGYPLHSKSNYFQCLTTSTSFFFLLQGYSCSLHQIDYTFSHDYTHHSEYFLLTCTGLRNLNASMHFPKVVPWEKLAHFLWLHSKYSNIT